MPSARRSVRFIAPAALTLFLGCGQARDPAPVASRPHGPTQVSPPVAPAPVPKTGAPGADSQAKTPTMAAGPGKRVGEAGSGAWDSLPSSEKEKLRGFGTLFLHQSVGQDLEDGAEAAGFKLNYYGPDHKLGPGLNGGIFVDVKPGLANGNPAEKLAVFREAALRHRAALKVAVMKFGYADVRGGDLASVQTQYQRTVADLRGAGIRVLHITPPLVFDVAENPPKMAMRTWMLSTFAADVVFDLQDIESMAGGARCEVSGTWRICPQVRSTAACPSKSQGIDGEGAGHLCEKAAKTIGKAFLYAIYQAAL